MRNRLIGLVAAALVSLGLAAAPAPAQASTGGAADGNLHPNVGLLFAYDAIGRYRCTGTLISPTVVLTAAHCTSDVIGKAIVTFDPDVAEDESVPLPEAGDPAAGFAAGDLPAGYVSGTAYTHPDYSFFSDEDNWNDVGVIVLDQPVTGIAPAPLAAVGTADTIKQPRTALFTAVGYGTEVRKADTGPQLPTPMDYPLIRRYVEMPGQKIEPQLITTNGNDKDPFGTGGTCFGDSGGPLLYQGEVIGVNSYGKRNCRYLDGFQRVDIAGVQSWLAGFLA